MTMVAEDLMSMNDDEFLSLVNSEIRDQAPQEMRHALREGPALERWYMVLQTMHKGIEGQFGAKAAEHTAKLKTMRANGTPARSLLIEEASFEQWRSGALRFKNGLEARLIEVKYLVRASRDERIDRTMQATLMRAGVLEDAIRRHRQAVEEAGGEPLDADRQLWEYLPAGWSFTASQP